MKFLAILVLGVLLVSLTGVMAQQLAVEANVNANANAGSNNSDDASLAASGQASAGGEGSSNVAALLRVELVNDGNYTGPFGLLVKVRAMEGGFQDINFRNVSAKSSLKLAVETDANKEVKIKARLSNGRDVQIKVMPDTASETALARLRLKVCSPENNCTIELKEVGANADAHASYVVKADQKVKVLGVFKANMHAEAEVNAEAQEAVAVNAKRPWWAFASVIASA